MVDVLRAGSYSMDCFEGAQDQHLEKLQGATGKCAAHEKTDLENAKKIPGENLYRRRDASHYFGQGSPQDVEEQVAKVMKLLLIARVHYVC